MIPESKWKWCGFAGHLIVGYACRFHLATRIGNYLVSTVGDYHPPHKKDEGAEEIGWGRKYETYVFKTQTRKTQDCNICGETDSMEIDSLGYNDWKEAQRGHMRLCKKFAGRK